MSVKFGTDGWRAVIAENFTFENVRLVSQAVAEYLLDTTNSNKPEIVIGFDTRFLSDRFAAEVARVMASNGIVACLARADAPTPAVSYNIVHKQALGGIMITASHNPPRYNGFKVKAAYGGAASKEQTKEIQRRLAKIAKPPADKDLIDPDVARERELINRFDPAWPYYEHLTTKLIDMDIIHNGELEVAVDSMYGAGRGVLKEIVSRTRTRIHELHGEMNPGFGGIHPEPLGRNLRHLIGMVQNSNVHFGLATDGDADRIGAVDERGNFVDPHTIMSLSVRYLVERRGLSGAIAKTISSTLMLNRMAKKYGLTLYETPVGFDLIAAHMLNDDVLLGGEESGGISIKGHIPEGDGILMGLLLMEIVSDARAPLSELVEDLQREFGPTVYIRDDIRLKQPISKPEMVRRLVDATPAHIAGEKVVKVDSYDGVKYHLADDSWLLIRPSGTEPVLRVYAESNSEEAVKLMIETGRKLSQAD